MGYYGYLRKQFKKVGINGILGALVRGLKGVIDRLTENYITLF